MVKQKIVLRLALDDERKRRKAFKAAVGTTGVTSATLEGDKIIIVGDGVDPITLTTMLRRGLGYAELLSVSSGDDKKKDSYGYVGGEKKKDGSYGYGGADGTKDSGGSHSKGGSSGAGVGGVHHQNAVSPVVPYPAYQQQYNTVPSYPVYSYSPYQQQQEPDPGCSIM
ncbi:uncharacterized protein LOC100826249 [Brachypodium distachyon]|uniref:HMA domain-containing protein n=1 Tax=Brachypodium distachyon TaxID=15368 RepID=I1HZE2_BRADI|nr:uncharacterized protein LOC100826249 [Brachypodium distachyon]KQJ94328.1 hypothetical protein BRADI_3g09910v3 [Brachypodium distachyon]KQJ94329.1 hypothetical protein BRADI_3g09910v3 [Brachypodium distachyon]|eukprot:XP_003572271.1 uncharacterized protein LOC100826249 [Brachypodium distachyon]